MNPSIKMKRSEIWNFFTKTDHEYATCNFCLRNLSYKTSTTNLKKHLSSRHPTVHFKIIKPVQSKLVPNTGKESLLEDLLLACDIDLSATAAVSEQEVQSSPVQPRPARSKQETVTGLMKRNMSQKLKQNIDKKLLQLFITDYQPFSIVDDKGFKEFVEALNPSYELPARQTISKTLIPALFEECRIKSKNVAESVEAFCITTDCWSSINSESYMAVTAHYVTDAFQMKSVLLECTVLEEQHSSKHLAAKLNAVVNDWNIQDKILLTVSDNGANIKEAITKELGWKHFGCFAHALNLIVKDALEETSIANLLSKIRIVVAHFKRCNLSNEKLLLYQKNLGHQPLKLIKDVQTRWNSTFYMVERFLKLEEAVRYTTSTLINRDIITLSAEEWKSLRELSFVLKPFADITKEISGDIYCTAALVIPLCNGLKNVCANLRRKHFSAAVVNAVQTLERGLNERFANIEKNKTLSVCTFIDPRFKHLPFTKTCTAEQAKEFLTSLLTAKLLTLELDKTAQSESELNQITTENDFLNKELNVWSQFDQVAEKLQPKHTPSSRALKEVQKYCDANILSRNENPLKWWDENKYVYPTLAEIAKERLCILSTSVPCERLFSKAGFILNEKRTRLSSRYIGMLLFLNVNREFLNESI